jgi:hypothetical protein
MTGALVMLCGAESGKAEVAETLVCPYPHHGTAGERTYGHQSTKRYWVTLLLQQGSPLWY